MDLSGFWMNVTLKHLRAFLAVARARGFTRAAETSGLSQPALTVNVRQLEEALGLALFERTTRRVRLTARGMSFLPTAERLVADFDDAIEAIRADAAAGRQRVSVAALPSMATLVMPQAVAGLIAQAPTTRVHVRDLNSSAVQRRVRAGEVDFGIGSVWEAEPDLSFEPLLADPFGVVCRDDHPLAQGDGPLEWGQLADYPFLGLALDTGIRPLIEQAGRVPEAVIRPQLEFSNILTLGAMLSEGVGVTAMPHMAFRCIGREGLVFRLLGPNPLMRTVCLVARNGMPLAPAAARFRTILQAACADFARSSPHVEDAQAAPPPTDDATAKGPTPT
jgi:DNA-binding transcriptional LysR family regulator